MSQKTAIAEIRSINPEEGLAVIELYGGTAKDRELVVGDKLYIHPSASVPVSEAFTLLMRDITEQGPERPEDERTARVNYDWLYERIQEAFAAVTQPAATSFQGRVEPWLLECFGEMIAGDKEERNHRFLEEALELVQACGCTADESHKLVDYVFGRPIGEKSQEVGGVHVTLAALCLAQEIDSETAAETELARITQPEMVERIREKQKRKPRMGPLPGVYPERQNPPAEGAE